MKRKWILPALLLTIALLLLFGGCDKADPTPETNNQDSDLHTCMFGEWSVLKSPTCNAEGTQTRACSGCGATETKPIEKTECTFGEWVTETEPTVEAVGLKTRTCTVCKKIESEEIAKLIPTFSISCKNGNKTTVVHAAEDGSYTLTPPTKLGYNFTGWKTEAGEDFAPTGTLTANVKIVAEWDLAKTTTFTELKERLAGGVDKILLDADITLSDTIYVTGKTTIYTTEDHTLTRAPEFIGDLFILGENSEGISSILLTGEAASLTLRTEDNAALTIDGNKTNMTEDAKGTVFFMLHSSILNLYDNVTVTNCKKIGNLRLMENDANLSKPHRVGGAAAIVADGVLNLYGATVSNCEVNTVDQKNIGTDNKDYNDSCCGGAIFNRSTVNMFSGTLSGNKASRGAAIFNYRTVNLKGGLIENNYAATYAAALYLTDSQYAYAAIGETTDEIKLTIRDNTSEKSGGAIFAQHQSVVQIYGGVEFNGNKSSSSNGGAINIAGALTVQGGRFINNLAASKGGAIYAYYSNAEQTVREVNITGGLFQGNEASKGGAVALGASKETFTTGAIVKISGGTFEQNRAFLTEAEDPDFIDNIDRVGVTKTQNGEGGAIYVVWKGQLTISGNTIIQNNSAEDHGGAIYMTSADSTVTINGTADAKPLFLENESAANGGAIYVNTSTVLTVNHAIFRNNKASGSEYGGGAIYFRGSTGNISNTSFEGNESLTKNGGAVAAYSSSTLTMNDVSFTSNAAADNGGAICLNKSNLTVETTLTLTQNTAAGDGGAIHMKQSTLTANAITATKNTAGGGGGAIYLNKADDASGASTLRVTTLTLSENEATGNGGALYVHTYDIAEIGTLSATGNTSKKYGGAIYASTGVDGVTITSVTATENEASMGGFLYLTSGGTVVTIYGGSASGNVADDGGATAYSNVTSAVLKLPATGFDYPADTISGKSGFTVTILPTGGNS